VDPSNGGVPDAPQHLDYPYGGVATRRDFPTGVAIKGLTIDRGVPDTDKKTADEIFRKRIGL
ncbi:MAG: hypothetical protein ABJE95_11045, partial [Byssovorax sp.]